MGESNLAPRQFALHWSGSGPFGSPSIARPQIKSEVLDSFEPVSFSWPVTPQAVGDALDWSFGCSNSHQQIN